MTSLKSSAPHKFFLFVSRTLNSIKLFFIFKELRKEANSAKRPFKSFQIKNKSQRTSQTFQKR